MRSEDKAADFSAGLSAQEQPAAPAALIGVGAAGRRLVARARLRLEQEPPPNADGLLLLTPDDGPEALAESVKQAARVLMRGRAVSALEERFAIRQPARRYLRLHLVFAAALAETDIATLQRCLEAAGDLQHPAAGMEILFLLDMTGPDDVGGVVPAADTALDALAESARRLRERQTRRWSTSARVRFLPVHPHRADGSWLDHPALVFPPASTSPDAPPEDEFEGTLAAGLLRHLTAGSFFDQLASTATEDERQFALWGWARDVLPREVILQGAAGMLAADALERTAAPEPGAEARALEAAAAIMVEEVAPDAWQAWLRTRDDVFLNRRALLKRLLVGSRPGAVAVEDAPPPRPRLSWYQKLYRQLWGETPLPHADGPERPLSVRLGLPAEGRQSGEPAAWPEAIRRMDAQGAEACDALIADLRTRDRSQQAAEEASLALARCVDVCIRGHLGGAQAAQDLIDDACRSARKRIAAAGTIPFAAPETPDGLGLPPGAGLAQAWRVYQERCARQPGWPAILSAGLAYGAVGMTACATFGLPVLLLGLPFAAVCVLASWAHQAWALGRLQRLGDFVREGIRAKYGRRLLEWAEQAAGSPQRDGVYQAVLRYLEDSERPAVTQFEAERAAVTARLRQPPAWDAPLGTDGFWADAKAIRDLYALARAAGGDSALADDARSLLRQKDIFAAWRTPALDEAVATARPFLRRAHLSGWERPARSLGDFLRDLQAQRVSEEDREAVFAAWVRQRMDRLALRSIPFALLPPSHPERADGDANAALTSPWASVTVAAPKSLAWSAVGDASPADPSQPPTDSAASDLTRWFGSASLAAPMLTDESDESACLTLLGGLSAAEALSAFPRPDQETAPAAVTRFPADSKPRNGVNGHAREPVPTAPPSVPEGGAA